MVVVAEPYAGLVRLLSGFIEQVHQLLIVVKGLSFLRLQDGIHHVLKAQISGFGDRLFPMGLYP
jgi:hypothetical protein